MNERWNNDDDGGRRRRVSRDTYLTHLLGLRGHNQPKIYYCPDDDGDDDEVIVLWIIFGFSVFWLWPSLSSSETRLETTVMENETILMQKWCDQGNH